MAGPIVVLVDVLKEALAHLHQLLIVPLLRLLLVALDDFFLLVERGFEDFVDDSAQAENITRLHDHTPVVPDHFSLAKVILIRVTVILVPLLVLSALLGLLGQLEIPDYLEGKTGDISDGLSNKELVLLAALGEVLAEAVHVKQIFGLVGIVLSIFGVDYAQQGLYNLVQLPPKPAAVLLFIVDYEWLRCLD